MNASKWTAALLPDLHGRSVIVTGGNSGIGRAAAGELARAGAAVTLAVRDTAKGAEAAGDMAGEVAVRPLDLADLASVRAFAEGTTDPVDILIANAGVMAVSEGRTADGFERQIGTNHLGHFALTSLLLERITDRIVVVSSLAHRGGRLDLGDLNWERRRYRAWAAYQQSKLANLLFVLELQSRLAASGSSRRALAVHPGWAATNLQSRTANRLVNAMSGLGNSLLAQSGSQGALPTLYAATADLPGGSFVGPDGLGHMRGYPAVQAPSAAALDRDVARQLWTLSEELTGIVSPLAPAPA